MTAEALPAARQKEAVFLPSATPGRNGNSAGKKEFVFSICPSVLPGVGQPFRRQRISFLPTKWEMILIFYECEIAKGD